MRLSVKKISMLAFPLFSLFFIETVNAAVSLDRTRIILNEGKGSVSLNITNNSPDQPYLAQAWIEDLAGKKIEEPILALPPIQRLEKNEQSQIKVQPLDVVTSLPQDKESVFYFNLREIPPRSDSDNVLQIALQTRVKIFYRPASLIIASDKLELAPQNKLTLEKQGNNYVMNNPTPYNITFVSAKKDFSDNTIEEFKSFMIEPNGKEKINIGVNQFNKKPILTYINDYGAQIDIEFDCKSTQCTVSKLNQS
ncbi:molecular chaperone [Proteus sp. GOKU]|uniref:fimbrial biogenesis chaperone n=1 Tax=Proteus TaxID=583 RepID=UPI0018929DE1|nr:MULTISPECIES: fimbria/pilus periplasmic chaperone [Proteus]QPB80738.1 molecular chaperone [Proteus sp. GOKU]QQP26745.1 molecular chaperone [Proteus vulgaris]WPC98524.1 fimbria/pilus periplasmic chaperone [Proteus terrae]